MTSHQTLFKLLLPPRVKLTVKISNQRGQLFMSPKPSSLCRNRDFEVQSMHAAASCPCRLLSWGLPACTPTCPNLLAVGIQSTFCLLWGANLLTSPISDAPPAPCPCSLTLGMFPLCYFSHFALCLSSHVGLSYKRDLTIFRSLLAHSLRLYTAQLNHSTHSFLSQGRA